MRADSVTNVERHERLANALGWFSIGLGLAEVLAPGKLASFIGLEDENKHAGLLRFYGMRELAAGAGILSQQQQASWVWARVAGDMLDLASLASAFRAEGADKSRLAAATAAVLGVTALDVMCGQALSLADAHRAGIQPDMPHAATALFINKSPEEVYRFWRNFENLPRFMHHIESVQTIDGRRSHWRARLPGGFHLEWQAETIEDHPNSLISWRSVEGSEMFSAGSVRFERAGGGRGTNVILDIHYAPPGGALSAAAAKFLEGGVQLKMKEDLRALKQLLEVGEIVKSDSSIHAGMHAARPPAELQTAQAAAMAG